MMIDYKLSVKLSTRPRCIMNKNQAGYKILTLVSSDNGWRNVTFIGDDKFFEKAISVVRKLFGKFLSVQFVLSAFRRRNVDDGFVMKTKSSSLQGLPCKNVIQCHAIHLLHFYILMYNI